MNLNPFESRVWYPPLVPGIAQTIKRMIARQRMLGLRHWHDSTLTDSRTSRAIVNALNAEQQPQQRAHSRDCEIMAYCRRQSRCDLLPQAYAADLGETP